MENLPRLGYPCALFDQGTLKIDDNNKTNEVDVARLMRELSEQARLAEHWYAADGAESPYCRFCGKGHNQVGYLFSGINAHICDDCLEVCFEAMEEEGLRPIIAPGSMPALQGERRNQVDLAYIMDDSAIAKAREGTYSYAANGAEPPYCRFCARGHNQVVLMFSGIHVHACNQCIALCHTILRQL